MNRVRELKKQASLPEMKKMLRLVDKRGQEVAVKRTIIRHFSLIEIPASLHGLAFDKASRLFSDTSEAIAVRVFAMTVMANIAMKEPGLKNEVIIAIEEQLPYGSAGLRSRARKLLKKLKGVGRDLT